MELNGIGLRKTAKSKLVGILKESSDWAGIYSALSAMDPSLAGISFEYLALAYLKSNPAYSSEYQDVWMLEDTPLEVKSLLNISSDRGIDLVSRNVLGELITIQCKFSGDPDKVFNWSGDKLTNFFSSSTKATRLILFNSGMGADPESLSKVNEDTVRLSCISSQDLEEISGDLIQSMIAFLDSGMATPLVQKKPREHQVEAIRDVLSGFKKHKRGQMIAACGSGKSLISLWIKEGIKSQKTILVVPSLSLLRQIKSEYFTNRDPSLPFVPYLSVCSETDINSDDDEIFVDTSEIGGMVTTNAIVIQEFFKKNSKYMIFSTYQSLNRVYDALKESGESADMMFLDEAHRTATVQETSLTVAHKEDFPVARRLYMTATQKVISASVKNDENWSDDFQYDMSNEKIYGPVFYELGFGEAIERRLLADYRILGLFVTRDDVRKAIEERVYINEDKMDAQELAVLIALQKAIDLYGLSHTITFHSSIKKAKAFNTAFSQGSKSMYCDTVTGDESSKSRKRKFDLFKNAQFGVLSNSRCLTEGIDIAAIDAVLFADPKQSVIDIIQAACRALRLNPKKPDKIGTIIVPVFVNSNGTAERSAYDNIIKIIRAMSSQDRRLVEEITHIKIGKLRRSTILSDSHRISFEGESLFDKELADKIQQYVNVSLIPRIRGRKWTLELCKSDALKYSSRSEWQKKSNNVYGAAFDQGWLDECCSHMKLKHNNWTLEKCLADAKQYKKIGLWQKASASASMIARNNGWFDECTKHMDIPNRWSLDKCKTAAIDYHSRSEWKRGSNSSYSAALKHGWVEECSRHMKPPQKTYTLDDCKAEAIKHKTRGQWSKSGGTYISALRNGWVEECSRHMNPPQKTYTLNDCKIEALKHTTRKAWQLASGTYGAAIKKGWMELCCGHMSPVKIRASIDECKADALKYETPLKWKKNSSKIYASAQRHGILDTCCSHMVGKRKKWTLEECKSDALKYTDRASWRENSSADQIARKNGWMEECCAHMVDLQRASGTWTREECLRTAKLCKSRTEWGKRFAGAAGAAYRNGWTEECCADMPVTRRSWTFEQCMRIAQGFKSRSEWEAKSPRTYSFARHHGWMEECTAHMPFLRILWTFESCFQDASKYNTKQAWREGSSKAHAAARKNGWYEECCKHMIPVRRYAKSSTKKD